MKSHLLFKCPNYAQFEHLKGTIFVLLTSSVLNWTTQNTLKVFLAFSYVPKKPRQAKVTRHRLIVRGRLSQELLSAWHEPL